MGLIDDIQHAQTRAAEDVVVKSLQEKGLMPDDNPNPTPNLGEQIDAWSAMRDEIRTAEAELSKLKGKANDLFDSIASNLDAFGIELARGKMSGTSVFFTENDTVQLDDPQAFGDYVVSSNQPYLYQARVSPKACLELIQQGEAIPGVKAVKLRKLSYKTGK